MIALLGGVVLATVAGARRTASAYPRMLAATSTPELLVSPPGEAGADPTPFYEAIGDMPGVRSLGVIAGLSYLPLAGSPTEALAQRLSDFGEIATMLGTVEGVAGYELRQPVITEGRLPAVERIDEVFISRQMAKHTGLSVGEVLDIVLVRGEQVFQEAADAGDGTPLRLEVVGVGTFANEVIPFNDLDEFGIFLVPPAVTALQERADWAFEGAFVDLDAGADPSEAVAAISTLGARPDAGTGGPVFISDETAQAGEVQDGMRPLAVALAAVAAAVGVVALVIVGQALARHTPPSAGDLGAMRAIGFGTSQRAAVPLVRALAIAVVGAAGAAVVSIALSPRFPIGPARVAERRTGVDVDAAVLALGAALVVVLTVAALVPAAVFRARRDRRRSVSLGRFATSAAGSARLPAPEIQGVRLAFGAGPDGSPPARNAVVVAVLAVSAVLGTAAFAHGLTSLVDEPARYGQGWDLLVDSGFTPVPAPVLVEQLDDDPRVDGLAVGNYGELSVAGQPVPAVELASIAGSVGITLVDGEVADDPGELVLGGEVLDALGLSVGDEVDVDAGHGSEPWRVVGRAVFPRMGRGSFDGTGLGVGAQVAPGPLALLDADEMFTEEGYDEADFRFEDRLYAFLAIDVHGDPAPVARDLEQLAPQYYADLKTDLAPTAIRDLDRVREVPIVLAALLAVVAAAALAHQLASSVRERRHELALLRMLGFSSSQLRRTVASQSALLAGVAVLLGVPLGLALGRIVWSTFATGLHVDPSAPMPWLWVAGAAPVALLLATALALAPAARAARVRVARSLRDEAL